MLKVGRAREVKRSVPAVTEAFALGTSHTGSRSKALACKNIIRHHNQTLAKGKQTIPSYNFNLINVFKVHSL